VARNSKKQNIDTIRKSAPKQKKPVDAPDKTLLSILEPDPKYAKTSKDSEEPKKHWLFKDVSFPKRKKKNSENLTKKTKEKNIRKDGKRQIIKPHHKKIAMAGFIVCVVFSVVTLVAGVAFAHQKVYANKVYPGVVVWGTDVGGKTMTEVQQLVTEKVKNYKVELTGPDQTYTATANDLGLTVESESIALSAYSKGRSGSFWDNYVTRARLMATKINWKTSQKIIRANDLKIEPKYSIDEKSLDNYLNKVISNINIAAKDSEVKVSGGSTQLIPAIYGREVKKDELVKELKDHLNGFEGGGITISTKTVKPAIVDDSAKEVVVQAQSIMTRPVTLTYKDQAFKPNKETVASWITFVKTNGSQNYSIYIDPSRMKSYFSFLGTQINISPVNKRVQVENGVKETVLQDGKDGLLIDETTLGKSISNTLANQPSVNLAIPMYVAKYKTEYSQILIADWDKYIDINLSTQRLSACEKGGVNCQTFAVTTGNSTHPTPVGTWLVHGKSAITRMTGGTPGVDYYDLPNVHWVTWFKGGGYSIHEAYWRSSFGGMDYTWNGSHGCVNAPLNVAKFIFDWAPIGTPVIVHY
jgi:hypothetical protein